MKLLVVVLLLTAAVSVAARSSHTASSSSSSSSVSDKDSIVQNLQKLKEMLLERLRSSKRSASEEAPGKEQEQTPSASTTTTTQDRKGKSIGYYPFFPAPILPGYFPPPTKDFRPILPEEWLSRTEPFKRKTSHLVDSPTYYIRLPPNPYVFVPGVGYVSRPPTMNDPEVLNGIPTGSGSDKPEPFFHLPVNFISNGKPTSVFQLPNDHVRPKPEQYLNKGPYVFNGKPSEIYLLRNSFNALYADALTNFYP